MKIEYIKDWHPTDGTCYRQRITVNQDEYNMINNIMTKEYRELEQTVKAASVRTEAQLRKMCYGKPLDIADKQGNVVYLNLTQLGMIAAIIHSKPEFAQARKRLNHDNTILMIKG